MRATMRGSICLLLLFTPVTVAYGQTFTGGIRGVVSDASGVVPGAPVTLINEATNDSRSTVSDERGSFQVTNLQPGSYTVRVELQSFRTHERKTSSSAPASGCRSVPSRSKSAVWANASSSKPAAAR